MADTAELIGGLAVEIVGDYSKLQADLEDATRVAQHGGEQIAQGLNQGAAGADTLDAKIQALVDSGQTLGDALKQLNLQTEGIGSASKTAADGVSGLGDAAQKVSEQAGAASQGTQQYADSAKHAAESSHEAAQGSLEFLKSLAEVAGITLTIEALKEFAAEAIKAWAAEEKFQLSLGYLMGSAEAAGGMIERLDVVMQELAIPEDQIKRGAQAFTVLGLSATDVEQTIRAAADAAAARGKDFDTAANSIYNMAMAGTAGGRQLKQLGIDAEDMAGVLGVSVDHVQEAFKSLTVEDRVDAIIVALDKWKGAAKETADGTDGSITRMKNAWEKAMEDIGKAIAPAVIEISKFLSDTAYAFQVGLVSIKGFASEAVDLFKAVGEAARGNMASAIAYYEQAKTTDDNLIKSLQGLMAAHEASAKATDTDTEAKRRHVQEMVAAAAAAKASAEELSKEQQAVQQFTTSTDAMLRKLPESYGAYIAKLQEGGQTAKSALSTIETAIDRATTAMQTMRGAPLAAMQELVDKLQAARDRAKEFAETDAFNKAAASIASMATLGSQSLAGLDASVLDFINDAIRIASEIPNAFNTADLPGLVKKVIDQQKTLNDQTEKLGTTFQTAFDKYEKGVQSQVVPITATLQQQLAGVDVTLQGLATSAAKAFPTSQVGQYLAMEREMNTEGYKTIQQLDSQIQKNKDLLDLMKKFNQPLLERLDLQKKIYEEEIKQAEAQGKSNNAAYIALVNIDQKIKDIHDSTNVVGKAWDGVVKTWNDAWDKMGKSIADNIVEAKDWGDVWKSVIKDIEKELLEGLIGTVLRAVRGAFDQALGGLLGGGGGSGLPGGWINSAGMSGAGAAGRYGAGALFGGSGGLAISGVGGLTDMLGLTASWTNSLGSSGTMLTGLGIAAGLGGAIAIPLIAGLTSLLGAKDNPSANAQWAVSNGVNLNDPAVQSRLSDLFGWKHWDEILKAFNDLTAGQKATTDATKDGAGQTAASAKAVQDEITKLEAQAASLNAQIVMTVFTGDKALAATLTDELGKVNGQIAADKQLLGQINSTTASAGATVAAETSKVVEEAKTTHGKVGLVHEDLGGTNARLDAVKAATDAIPDAFTVLAQSIQQHITDLQTQYNSLNQQLAQAILDGNTALATKLAGQMAALEPPLLAAQGSLASINGAEQASLANSAAVKTATEELKTALVSGDIAAITKASSDLSAAMAAQPDALAKAESDLFSAILSGNTSKVTAALADLQAALKNKATEQTTQDVAARLQSMFAGLSSNDAVTVQHIDWTTAAVNDGFRHANSALADIHTRLWTLHGDLQDVSNGFSKATGRPSGGTSGSKKDNESATTGNQQEQVGNTPLTQAQIDQLIKGYQASITTWTAQWQQLNQWAIEADVQGFHELATQYRTQRDEVGGWIKGAQASIDELKNTNADGSQKQTQAIKDVNTSITQGIDVLGELGNITKVGTADIANAIQIEQQNIKDLQAQADTLNQQLITAQQAGDTETVARITGALKDINDQILADNSTLSMLVSIGGDTKDQIQTAGKTVTDTLKGLESQSETLHAQLLAAQAAHNTQLVAQLQDQIDQNLVLISAAHDQARLLESLGFKVDTSASTIAGAIGGGLGAISTAIANISFPTGSAATAGSVEGMTNGTTATILGTGRTAYGWSQNLVSDAFTSLRQQVSSAYGQSASIGTGNSTDYANHAASATNLPYSVAFNADAAGRVFYMNPNGSLNWTLYTQYPPARSGWYDADFVAPPSGLWQQWVQRLNAAALAAQGAEQYDAVTAAGLAAATAAGFTSHAAGGYIPKAEISQLHPGEFVFTASDVETSMRAIPSLLSALSSPSLPSLPSLPSSSVSASPSYSSSASTWMMGGVTIHVHADPNPRETARLVADHMKRVSNKFHTQSTSR